MRNILSAAAGEVASAAPDVEDLTRLLKSMERFDVEMGKLPSRTDVAADGMLPLLCCCSDRDVWQVLRKTVAVLLAHAGFDGAEESALDTLADIMKDYISRFVRAVNTRQPPA